MQNNSKVNTILLIIIVILLGIGIWLLLKNKNQSPVVGEYDQSGTQKDDETNNEKVPEENPVYQQQVTLDMSSPYAVQYKTLLTQALGRQADYNGHYVVASVGCGSGCFGYYVVDKNTGKVYKVPELNDYGSFMGEDGWRSYTLNSNFIRIITNNGTTIKTYSFNGSTFTLYGTALVGGV